MRSVVAATAPSLFLPSFHPCSLPPSIPVSSRSSRCFFPTQSNISTPLALFIAPSALLVSSLLQPHPPPPRTMRGRREKGRGSEKKTQMIRGRGKQRKRDVERKIVRKGEQTERSERASERGLALPSRAYLPPGPAQVAPPVRVDLGDRLCGDESGHGSRGQAKWSNQVVKPSGEIKWPNQVVKPSGQTEWSNQVKSSGQTK